MQKIVILGTAYPFRGGLSTFNERLARAFIEQGLDTVIYNFSLQYPSILFPGKTQYSNDPAPSDLRILSRVNSVNPLNWLWVGRQLSKLKPDLVIVKFWLPLMGPAFGTILRLVKKNQHTKVISIIDNLIPHEKRPGDRLFTKYFLKACDAFITMSDNVMKDLKTMDNSKPAVLHMHPLYDNFGNAIKKEDARRQLRALTGTEIKDEFLMLFFGFIRRYKGLDLLFEAVHILKFKHRVSGLKLVVAGEFYEEPGYYDELIRKLDIQDMLVLKTDFVAEDDVKIYFGAADVVVQPYRSATQSGVTPLAYHFEKPMIVTKVGALPDYVPHNKVGLVTDPEPSAIADAILRYRELGEAYFLPQLREEKKKYSWTELICAITALAHQVGA